MDCKDLVLINMMENGDVIRKGNIMATFQPINDNIKIELERKENRLWYNENGQYQCIFRFIDKLTNRVIIESIASEKDIFILLDLLEEWCSYNYTYECNHTLSKRLSNGNFYTFSFTMDHNPTVNNYNSEFDPVYVLTVREFDIKQEMYFDRVKILFNYSGDNVNIKDSLFDFMDLMFFIFLIDLVSGGPTDEVEYLYPSIYDENMIYKSK